MHSGVCPQAEGFLKTIISLILVYDQVVFVLEERIIFGLLLPKGRRIEVCPEPQANIAP